MGRRSQPRLSRRGATEGGVVYHPNPTYDLQIKASAAGRAELVHRLNIRAIESNIAGDRMLQRGDYSGANVSWTFAGRCVRAAASIQQGRSTDFDVHQIVGQIWADVLVWAEHIRSMADKKKGIQS